jgi:hypothetical protein
MVLSFQQRNDALERKLRAAFATTLSGVDVWNFMPTRREG